jgi:glucose/arabinose dehydrogenase
VRVALIVAAACALLIATGSAVTAAIGPKRFLVWAGWSAAESRLVTGIAVAGTADSPVVYVTSSDPRLPGYLERERLPLDTNSGVVSLLAKGASGWARRDLVQGLPRSLHDHATNGIVLDEARDRLLVAQGAMTNMGAPSMRFDAPEYALSASILSIDLRRLGGEPYALPTLDDETRPGQEDAGDPFGGNRGLNQAVIRADGPVQLYATGFRNPYDLVLTRKGALFATDNGPNWFWGAPPRVTNERCTNRSQEGGRYVADSLLLVDQAAYLGHPNPTRSSTAVTFNRSNPQSPIDRPRPGECTYGQDDPGNALARFETSTNGLAEYTSSNFGGSMSGDLVAASFDRRIYRVDLDGSGRKVLSKTSLAEIEAFPLDVTTQPDNGPFPGTIWVADWLSGDIVVMEPRDRRSGAHWEALAPTGFPRQEVAWVRAGDRFYLAGGDRRHEVYDPATDAWEEVAELPEQLDHIQGVSLGGRIYYIGGLSAFPEPAVGSVSIYDPRTDTFERGAPMRRPRGAGGVAVYEGKIYYAGGLSEGRAVPWFDVYDPATDSWSRLPDMPRSRDHFQAQVAGSRFYAIGGRDTDVDANISDNNAFDFARGRWVSGLAPLPTARGGYASARVGDEILVIGGESSDRVFAEVEAYDVRTDTWRTLDPMSVPRHGIQAIACAGDVFIAAGGEEPFDGAPSTANSVYVSRPTERCALTPRDVQGRSGVGFRTSRVPAGLAYPTSLQFGPDGRLYVSEQEGAIKVLTLHRTDAGDYEILGVESLEQIRQIPNHDDDGSAATSWNTLFRLAASTLGICCSFSEGPQEPAPPVPSGPADPARGRVLFRDADCAGCHTFAPAGSNALTGPPLDRTSELPASYLEQAILEPDSVVTPGYMPGVMPPDYRVTLDTQQLADIIAFIRETGRKR